MCIVVEFAEPRQDMCHYSTVSPNTQQISTLRLHCTQPTYRSTTGRGTTHARGHYMVEYNRSCSTLLRSHTRRFRGGHGEKQAATCMGIMNEPMCCFVQDVSFHGSGAGRVHSSRNCKIYSEIKRDYHHCKRFILNILRYIQN